MASDVVRHIQCSAGAGDAQRGCLKDVVGFRGRVRRGNQRCTASEAHFVNEGAL